MEAFRVSVDGKCLGDLGVPNYGNVAVIVGFGRGRKTDPASHSLSVAGLTLPDEDGIGHHYRWSCPNIQIGSRIEIEVVDSEHCVPPARVYRSDHLVQESAFTDEEMREMRYENYLALKEEFEPPVAKQSE